MMKKLLFALGLAIASPVLSFAAVSAAVEPSPNVVDEASGTLWVVSAWWVTLIAAALIPFFTGILTKWNTRSGIKTAITLLFNLGTAFFTTGVLEDGTALFSGQMVQTFVLQVIISFATYEWGWKKAGLTSSSVKLPDLTHEGRVVYVPGKLAFFGVK